MSFEIENAAQRFSDVAAVCHVTVTKDGFFSEKWRQTTPSPEMLIRAALARRILVMANTSLSCCSTRCFHHIFGL
jgi:hypothetical protein